jgi:hypothetical protein
MEKDFIIDQVSWHTQAKRNYEFDNDLFYLVFESIIIYFQKNGLTTRTILFAHDKVNDDTCIKASDLTNEGLLLVKKAYGKWMDKAVDKIIQPTDFKMLDNALKK